MQPRVLEENFLSLVSSLCRGKCVEPLLLRQIQSREEEEKDSSYKATKVSKDQNIKQWA